MALGLLTSLGRPLQPRPDSQPTHVGPPRRVTSSEHIYLSMGFLVPADWTLENLLPGALKVTYLKLLAGWTGTDGWTGLSEDM